MSLPTIQESAHELSQLVPPVAVSWTEPRHKTETSSGQRNKALTQCFFHSFPQARLRPLHWVFRVRKSVPSHPAARAHSYGARQMPSTAEQFSMVPSVSLTPFTDIGTLSASQYLFLSSRRVSLLSVVSSLRQSLAFFAHLFDMKVLRHEEFDADCTPTFDGPLLSSYGCLCSKTTVGLTSESGFVLELICASGVVPCRPGHSFRYITINVPGAASRAKTAGWRVDTSGDGDAVAVINGPDGMNFRCIEESLSPSHMEKKQDEMVSVAVSVSDIDLSLAFYCRVLGMEVLSGKPRSCMETKLGDAVQVGYDPHRTRLELVHMGQKVEHGDSIDRLVFSTSSVSAMYSRARAAGAAIVLEPTTLHTAGNDDAEVLIVRDLDGYELCYVDEAAFRALSKKDGATAIDWDAKGRAQRELEMAQGSGPEGQREPPFQPPSPSQSGPLLLLADREQWLDESEFLEGGDEHMLTVGKHNHHRLGEALKRRLSQSHAENAVARAMVQTPSTATYSNTWISSSQEKIPAPLDEQVGRD
jgi:catechol 2,3-dioxygenase-like lactoylglutathione lyase family enzyme